MQFGHDSLEPLFKITAIFGAGNQRAHVQGIDGGVGQRLRYFAFDDKPGQSLCDGGFTHASLAHIKRIVLTPAAQDLDGALDLQLTSNQWIDAPLAGELVEVAGVLIERTTALGLTLAFSTGRFALRRLIFSAARDAMREVLRDIQTSDAMPI